MRPLDDLRVLDLTHIFNDPYAAQVLGFLGVEIIKVEALPHGERARHLSDPGRQDAKLSVRDAQLEQEGITLNLKSERGHFVRSGMRSASVHVPIITKRPFDERHSLQRGSQRQLESLIIRTQGDAIESRCLRPRP